MRKPTLRSPSSSSRASTSSIRASESASRSSAKRVALADAAGLDLEDVGQAVTDELEHGLAVHRGLLHVGLGDHTAGQCTHTSRLRALVNASGWPTAARRCADEVGLDRVGGHPDGVDDRPCRSTSRG